MSEGEQEEWSLSRVHPSNLALESTLLPILPLRGLAPVARRGV